jgi:hypothetical protein
MISGHRQLAVLTDTELSERSERVYRAVVRLFDAATVIFGQMSQTQTWTPEYEEMKRRSAVLMAAGREQNQLHGEISQIIRERREEADLRARIGAALGNAMTDEEFAAAVVIEHLDQADDPMKMEN